MRSVVLRLIVATFTLSIAAQAEQSGQSDTLDTLLDLTIVRDAYIAPDGQHIAFITFENDFKNDKDMNQLWVVSTADSEPVQLTHGEDSVGEIEWSANSEWIAFMRKGKLGFIRASGGEAKMADLDIKGISSLRFAPDGNALYFTAGPDNKDLMKARKERYGDYNVVREDGGYQHIWRVGITADMEIDGEPEQLTNGRDFSVTGYAISPNGQQIAFATWPSPHLADLLKGRMYVMNATDGEPELIDDTYGVKSRPVWHQNDNKIAYTNATGFPTLSDIVTRNANGRNANTIEMKTYDPFIVRYTDDTITFSASERTDLALFQINTKSKDISRISSPDKFSYGFSISDDGNNAAFLSATSSGMTEVTMNGGSGDKTLTTFSTQINELEKPTRELITWTSDEGLEIEAVLTKPAGYKAGKRYPLYVRTHGGPTGTDRPWMAGSARSIYHPDVLAAEGDGALVLQTNYRGSAGYGEAFQSSNLKNLGIGPARDIIAGINMLIESGMVDPDRVACLGWSQGGHISAMLATYSDICTAAIMGAGISDWRTYYYNTDITQFTTEYFGATPLADDAVYAKTSPVTYIDNAQTPVLIQHGENDQRVPIANGYQFRQLLLDKGVDARMLVYGGMRHGPSKPRTRRAITEHALAWLREQMFDKEKANFVTPVAKAETDDQ